MKLHDIIERDRKKLKEYDIETDISYGLTIWTRGDGYRYKEDNKLICSDPCLTFSALLGMYPSARKLQVTGEFGSNGFDNALIAGGILYIKRGFYIQFATPSILRNESVWRSRDRFDEDENCINENSLKVIIK